MLLLSDWIDSGLTSIFCSDGPVLTPRFRVDYFRKTVKNSGHKQTPMKRILHPIYALALAGMIGSSSSISAAEPGFWASAATPPMGWNSWDCYGAGVWESNVLANADYMAGRLKSHGWNVITIDIQWYEPLAHTTGYRDHAVLEMDANGRLLPAPNRFPMTRESRSFKPIAEYLHARGLKFGLHLLRGIPRQAVERDNSPILGTSFKAADIADTNSLCRWNTDMYGVDMSKPGAQAYYDSVFALFASWDLDFVKVDDLSSPYHKAEIEAIRKAIDKTGRPIVFSTSPGATPVSEGSHIQDHANLWRVSDDFWDDWRALHEQFARLDHWTPFRGPGHWPDGDMLPLGHVRTWQSKDAWTHFTRNEQVALMTLWCMARSPLIMGGDLPSNDEWTLSLMTNDEILGVNQASLNNRQLFNHTNAIAWVADVPESKDRYVALFNTVPLPGTPVSAASQEVVTLTVPLADLGFTGSCRVRDLWAHKDLETAAKEITIPVKSHGAVLLRVSPE